MVVEELLRVVDVDAYINYSDRFNPYTVLQCTQDGRLFNLYLVPLEIVLAIYKLKGHVIENNRETLFELLTIFGYTVARADLTGLVQPLRKLSKDHKAKLIITGYSWLEKDVEEEK